MHVVKPGIAGATFVFVIRIVFSSARGTHPSFYGQFSLEVWTYISDADYWLEETIYRWLAVL